MSSFWNVRLHDHFQLAGHRLDAQITSASESESARLGVTSGEEVVAFRSVITKLFGLFRNRTERLMRFGLALSLLMVGFAVVGVFIFIPFVSAYAFWIVVAAYVLLAAGRDWD